MKKLLMALVTVALFSNIAFAMPQLGDDGIAYWNGDANYPIWDTGNHGGSCVDLSSAVLKTDNQSECLIAVLDYYVSYDRDSMESAGVVLFREDKRSGQLQFKTEGGRWGWQSFGPTSRPAVYYLVKSYVAE